MTRPTHDDNRWHVISHCLTAASHFVPPSQSPAPALQSLRDMIPSLPNEVNKAIGPPATVQQTLELVRTASNLLFHLDGYSFTNPLSWESVARAGRILEDLTIQLEAIVRKETADLVRGLYVIVDPKVTGGREPMAIARASVRGGARMLQLRDKLRDKGQSLALGCLLYTSDAADE